MLLCETSVQLGTIACVRLCVVENKSICLVLSSTSRGAWYRAAWQRQRPAAIRRGLRILGAREIGLGREAARLLDGRSRSLHKGCVV